MRRPRGCRTPGLFECIESVLPLFADRDVENGSTREQIVDRADALLVDEQPSALAVAEPSRRRIIRGLVDILLDDGFAAAAREPRRGHLSP